MKILIHWCCSFKRIARRRRTQDLKIRIRIIYLSQRCDSKVSRRR